MFGSERAREDKRRSHVGLRIGNSVIALQSAEHRVMLLWLPISAVLLFFGR